MKIQNRDTFSSYHPSINFLYFTLVLVFSMCFMHPASLLISLCCAAAYNMNLNGRKAAKFQLTFLLPMMLIAAIVNPAFNHEGANPHEDCVDKDETQYGIRTPEEVSEFIMKGMNMGLTRLKSFDKDGRCLVSIPGMAEYRKTRAIVGEYTLAEKDREQHFEDSIGCTKEEFEPHLIEIPYRCLVSRQCDNILASGRIVSCDGRPRDTLRLIALCALTGEAAGLAASMITETGAKAVDLDVKDLQKKLIENENKLHF